MAYMTFPRLDFNAYYLPYINRPDVCHQYVDNLAYEHVIHSIFYPSFGYYVQKDFKFWTMPYALATVQELTNPNIFMCDGVAYMDNKCLYKELGVNYFELLRQYQEHICVMKLQEGRKYELDLDKIS